MWSVSTFSSLLFFLLFPTLPLLRPHILRLVLVKHQDSIVFRSNQTDEGSLVLDSKVPDTLILDSPSHPMPLHASGNASPDPLPHLPSPCLVSFPLYFPLPSFPITSPHLTWPHLFIASLSLSLPSLTRPCFASCFYSLISHLALSRLVRAFPCLSFQTPHLTSPHLAVPYLSLICLTLPFLHVASPCLVSFPNAFLSLSFPSPHLTWPHLFIASSFFLPRLVFILHSPASPASLFHHLCSPRPTCQSARATSPSRSLLVGGEARV